MGTSSWIIVLALRAFVHGDAGEEPTESQPSEPTTDVAAPAIESTAPASVALEPVRFGDSGDERVAKAFEAALREQLAADMSLAPACTAEPCPAVDDDLPRIRVDVRERERDYTMTIAIVDAQGNVAKTRDADCTVCTPTEAATVAANATRELMAAGSDRARLHVDSRPSGAEVWLDGMKVGTTPADLTTEPGPHTVEVRLAGHYNKAREIELQAGDEESVRLELSRDRGGQHKSMKIAGWTLIGVGVAALVGGITLMAIDENPIKSDCSGSHVDAFGNCEFRWNTMAGGATLLVGGLAAAGAGTALVVIGSSKRRAELRGGPTHASITVRF